MLNTCFHFQVHQPFRLRPFGVFDIGIHDAYFNDDLNRQIAAKIANNCYLPMNRLLLEQIERHQGAFKVAFSISGTALEQFEQYTPEVLESFRRLASTGCVEFLGETYFHSLSYVFDRDEFDRQVGLHRDRTEAVFGQRPRVFQNTELIFRNDLADHIRTLGFGGVLAEGADCLLASRSPNFVYRAKGSPHTPVLLNNYRLSGDIAFRFGNVGWAGYPLTVDRFVGWLNESHGNGEVVGLFMDYETFGEHQWQDSGIFEFMRRLPERVLSRPDNRFMTPGEVVERCEAVGEIDAPDFVSWADTERDLTPWLGNQMQQTASSLLYELLRNARHLGNTQALQQLSLLSTSDHLHYMCTKWCSEGDVHKYFSPHEAPHAAYSTFMNVLRSISEVHELECTDSDWLHGIGLRKEGGH